jgi:hypothetical protein
VVEVIMLLAYILGMAVVYRPCHASPVMLPQPSLADPQIQRGPEQEDWESEDSDLPTSSQILDSCPLCEPDQPCSICSRSAF